ncbi:hypothetical protein L6272_04170 [Microgenomates group bacterium]|nr:hypothetical protein [Microgenomates group bacterium]
MKKLFLLILGLGIIAGLFYFSGKKMPDETKTQGEPEESMEIIELSPDNSLTTIDAELQATELSDFDQEIQALDESINQL